MRLFYWLSLFRLHAPTEMLLLSKLFWKYGSTNLKILKANLDIEYLKKCKIFNVIPKFLRFKLYKRSLHSAKFYKSWQSKLLLREISSRKLAVKRLTLEQHDLEEKLRNQLSSFNLSMVLRFFRKQNSLKCDNIKQIHQRKLQSLGVSNDLAPCNPDNAPCNPALKLYHHGLGQSWRSD